jgi:glycosyltransferase involved in cell wall biosynthesis
MAKRLAIYSPVGSMALPDQAFGKDVANLGLYRALARYGGFERIDIQTAQPVDPGQLAEGLLLKQQLRAGLAVPAIARRSLLDLQGAVDAGLLLRGQPYLGELAWMRRRFSADQAYSLVGLIHTLAPPAIREQIGAVLETPVRPWDALICTSTAVRQGVEALLAAWQEHLARELGAQRFSWPQLPIIPLAVDVPQIRAQAQAPEARESLRQELGLAAEDLMVLWVGRLSYFEKAFPQPMFAAVEQAARRTGKRLHFALVGWFANGQADLELFQEAARLHAPHVVISVLDGRNSEILARCWAAADLFLSLVDNAQETFGLAPVEAMAAGLPVVVSDWNGYRFTVKDQQEGFLIPTLVALAGAIAEELAAGRIDGFCAGEPWGSRAVDLRCGRIALTTADIWPHHPEKVLAISAARLAEEPAQIEALAAAVVEAGIWLTDPAHRADATRIIQSRALPEVPAEIIALALSGQLVMTPDEAPRPAAALNATWPDDRGTLPAVVSARHSRAAECTVTVPPPHIFAQPLGVWRFRRRLTRRLLTVAASPSSARAGRNVSTCRATPPVREQSWRVFPARPPACWRASGRRAGRGGGDDGTEARCSVGGGHGWC